MDQLFFELIRISIGKQDCFSTAPSKEEWKILYDMSKKHAIAGICFVGVRRIKLDNQKPPKDIYSQWLGLTFRIQHRNELMNQYSVYAEDFISGEGFKTCILKGQGIAQNYGEKLSCLRQSGDIDIWVDGGMKKALSWARNKYGNVAYDYINAHLPMFKEIEVELHWRVRSMSNLFRNKRFQRWMDRHQDELLNTIVDLPNNVGSIHVPSLRFNRFYILLHCYNHMFSEGLGLRQIMDLFFVLEKEKMTEEDNLLLQEILTYFGVMKFTKAMMWLLYHVFGIEKEYMICEPDEKEGRYILREVMKNGNMGHHDTRIKHIFNSSKLNFVIASIQHSSHLLTHYPNEFLCQPIWILWHFIWKRINSHFMSIDGS